MCQVHGHVNFNSAGSSSLFHLYYNLPYIRNYWIGDKLYTSTSKK